MNEASEKIMSQTDQLREYAQKKRVFSRKEVVADIGVSAANAINQMAGEDIIRHARGIYSIAGILPNDERVLQKINETNAKPLSEEDRARDAKKAEQNALAQIASKVKTEDTLTDKIIEHFKNNPIASASDLKRQYGRSAPATANLLEKRSVIKKVRDGLWMRKGINPFGQEMSEYVQANSQELASVKREISEVEEFSKLLNEGRTQIDWNISQVKNRATCVYMNMVGIPSIWAKSHKGEVRWYAVKNIVSPLAAEHIARMVLKDMPDTIHKLIHLVKSGNAPTQMLRRHGGFREFNRNEKHPKDNIIYDYGNNREKAPSRDYNQNNEGQEKKSFSQGYTTRDTAVLDPRRLGSRLKEPIILEIDDREDDRLVTMLTDVPNLSIIRTHLEMADFIARPQFAIDGSKTLAIERKTSSDLSASLDDNRLAEQVHRMSSSQMACCFIIEGGVTGVRTQPLPRLASLQTRLNFGVNMRVLETIDMAHTAYLIVTIIRDHFFGTGTAFDLRPNKIPALGPIERAQYMLQTIPGISPVRSAALLTKFGTIAGVASASAKEIATIDGIGKKTAETLYEVLNSVEK